LNLSVRRKANLLGVTRSNLFELWLELNVKYFLYVIILFLFNHTPVLALEEEHFIKLSLNEIEDDMTELQWRELINEITFNLQSVYHPTISLSAIEQFRDDLSVSENLTIVNLRSALKRNFGVGYLGIARKVVDLTQIPSIIETRHENKTRLQLIAEPYYNHVFGYLYNDNKITYEDIKKSLKKSQKISVKIMQDFEKRIAIIKVPTFESNKGCIFDEIKTAAKGLGKFHEEIILDLRDNTGGSQGAVYYFTSLFLGDDEPDISQIGIDSSLHIRKQTSRKQLECDIVENIESFPPYYDRMTFREYPDMQKNTCESVIFNKMIILINGNTMSSGEIAAAVLKSTLGARVCVLGSPARGSFEEARKKVELPHQFMLYLPGDK
jgi:hypothetical protein